MYSTPTRSIGTVLLSAAISLLAGSTALAREAPTESPLDLPQPLADSLEARVLRTADELRLLQRQVRQVVAASRPATVAVELDDSVGSGVIISPDGLVLTAGHVCGVPNRQVYVRFADGTRVPATSFGVNHELDSGMVRIDGAPPADDQDGSTAAWPHRPLAEDKPELGEWVVGLGHPNGFVPGRAPPVRLGRVLHFKDDLICTDVTLVGGDSGGPLLNLRGEVIGIHSRIGESITTNFHVPVSLYQEHWSSLLAGRLTGVPDGEDPDDWRPHVGIAMRPSDSGPVVTQVFNGQPADKAGVLVGDLILSINHEEVDSREAVGQAVAKSQPFERVPLVVRRGSESIELEVWLGRVEVGFPGFLLNRVPYRKGRR